MTNMQVANTIKAQIGGTLAMVGASQLLGNENSLRMKVGTNPKKVTHITVQLDMASDTYTVTASKYSPRNLTNKILETREMVYADSLRPLIGEMTGLDLRL